MPPQIVDDRTLVPMRAALEALGASILWDESTSTVHAQGPDGTVVSLQIGSDKLFVPGDVITLDVPARIIGDRTMVPILRHCGKPALRSVLGAGKSGSGNL